MATLASLQNATRTGGHFALCTFNSRRQDLTAHPGFNPYLTVHSEYLSAFSTWEIIAESDSDLTERHPHNNVEHTHSLSRIVARKARPSERSAGASQPVPRRTVTTIHWSRRVCFRRMGYG